MSENWSLQASFRFGPNTGSMLNVRADDVDDLVLKSIYLTEKLIKGNALAELQDALNGVTITGAFQNVQQVFPNAQPVQQQPQGWGNQANVGPPHCAHGPMKDLGHKGYKHRYYCPLPKGAQGVCDARD